ncbi:putative transmembrane protein [Phytophthora cinnamomi]|uniref:putative transmembrane protein n=1 Tax=Phytophthora cinnamomi TaxID=4785 RepID=UPI00355A1726|nr:putative transmembrane protein [Phytophthora cinnamomi]
MNVINTMNLSIPPQQMQELELGVENADECVTTWSIMATARLFFFPTTFGSADFGKIPAVVVNVGPDYTECRPNVPVGEIAMDSKLAVGSGGKDLLTVVPEVLTLFPYSFTSSLAPISRVVAAGDTKYKADTVLEPLLQAYYGGCRVREVNTSGVYIEDTCTMSTHWEIYGLMVQSPDDVPLCSTSDVCIHN